jgi:hypothetical protein
MISINLFAILNLVARGGGGGSGGGSGSDGGELLLFIIGYLPVSTVTSKVLKRFGHKASAMVGIPFAIIWASGLWFLVGGFIGFLLAVAAIGGFFGGYYGLYSRILKRSKKAKKLLANAANLDPAWNQESMRQRIETVFYQYQKDWSELNTTNITTYTSESYAYHNWLMLTALYQLSRKNIMNDVQLTSIEFVDINDSQFNDQDSFTAYIDAKATDQLLDIRSQEVLYTDNRSFSEYWIFTRHLQKGWILSEIKQVTEK